MRSRTSTLTGALFIVFLVVSSITQTASARHFRGSFDVACDFNTIRFEGPQGPNPDDPNDVGPHPYYGASFVVQGVIYRAGTLEPGCVPGTTGCGLLPDGTPEFPDQVIGRWICRGWFIGDSADPSRGGIFTPSGPFVATTQIYEFGNDGHGRRTLVSEGIELIDLNEPFRRAITGGTGRFRSSRGEIVQTAIGVNGTGLFNFAFDLNLRP